MSQFWQDRITKIETMIAAYEDAVIYLAANPTKSYGLDTGQSEQKVTYFDLDKLQQTLNSLINQRDIYKKRISTTVTINCPGF